MKNIYLLLLGLVLLHTCGLYAAVSGNNDVVVKVGIYENKPKIYTDEQGNATGFWPNITNYIASKEGWKIEWVHGTWTQCLERLKNNEIDMMPDVAYSEERDKLYDFSQETVYVSWSRIYAKAGSDIQSVLDLEGKSVAVLEGSINFIGPDGIKSLTESFNINCTFKPMDSYLEVFELVDKKEADAGVVSKDFAYQHQSEYNLIETPIIFQPARLYFAFPPESVLKPYLIAQIDNDIKELKEDGESIYYQLLKDWFGIELTAKPIMPDWAKWMLIGVGILVVLLVGGTFVLRTQVSRKTRELEKDITRRKQTEKELRESEEKLQSVLATIPLGLLVLDLEGKIIQANRMALQIGNYNSSDLIGKNYLNFVVISDQEKARTNLKNTLEIGFSGSTEYLMIRQGGEEYPAKINMSLIRDPLNNPAGYVIVIEDMTIQRQAKKSAS